MTPWIVADRVVGVALHGELLPAPAIGLETELGVIAPGSAGDVVPALQSLLARRRGVVARATGQSDQSPFECERQFDTLGSTYQEGDHLEVNTFLWRSAFAARHNLEQRLEHAGDLARAAGQGVVLHATGGDCQGSSWSSLHVNTPISDLGYGHLASTCRAVELALDYYLPAQVSLAIIDGNGGVDPAGFVVSDRLPVFDAVFGSSTMRPSRAMLVDRSERFGNARIMHMLRALSFGRASITGLALTQLDCLICDLVVHGAWQVPKLALGDPVAAARALAFHEQRRALATLAGKVQGTRRRVVDALLRALGHDLVEQLVPGVVAELDFADATIAAVLRDDEAELVERCDWARKRAVFCAALGNATRWEQAYEVLVELNFHYARLDADALRHAWPGATLPDRARHDPAPRDTSSWLLHQVCARAEHDREWRHQLRDVTIAWQGLRRDQVAGCGVARRRQQIELQPWRFTQRELGERLARVASVDDLFAWLGTETALVYRLSHPYGTSP